MPKTGSSSIQETLFWGLKDPRFHYFSAGEINGSNMIRAIVANRLLPEFQSLDIAKVRARYFKLLARCAKKTIRNGRNLILSGENGWSLNRGELGDLRSILNDFGFEVEVIVYLRPWKEFLESRYQQVIQSDSTATETIWPPLVPKLGFAPIDYRGKIEQLDHVFGRSQVAVRKYDSKLFPDRCIVKDFCRQAGIDISGSQVIRTNDSLSLRAIRLLVAYRAFSGHMIKSDAFKDWSRYFLLQALRQLPGDRLRFHSRLILEILTPLQEQSSWLENRLGQPFQEDWTQYDDGRCIRSMEDLLCFDQESLEWLAEQAGVRTPTVQTGEVAARWVAEQMERLRYRRPDRSDLFPAARRWIGMQAIRTLYGR
jgi:hypothetical protein